MDRLDGTTSNEPTYLDALLFMGLDYAERTRLKDAYALVDVLEHMIIEPHEWEHACAVLGRRGLIVTGDPCPKMTDAGRILLMHYSTRLSRPVARQIAEELGKMPADKEPVAAPSREVQARAVAEYQSTTGGQSMATERA